MLSLVDAWIKAAVEHKTLEITYVDSKGKTSVREVEPDFYGQSRKGTNFGLWGTCLLRGQIRCFREENVRGWCYVGTEFSPNPQGRWIELLSEYDQRRLNQEQF